MSCQKKNTAPDKGGRQSGFSNGKPIIDTIPGIVKLSGARRHRTREGFESWLESITALEGGEQ